eukprot:CAMPEP_0196653158 /NCGR_PEP_ID=MMETSP1086-20130531/2761_1 /TAXON_ID=77921 /ORGANISM="Cyanoptyche  gloeocystis , Strain SAG4.97" /LENGTH=157 /DNA_ID=CAMNT_0041984215 /DNA_START=219 /DNA_END=692 /DNA_ORIENTATION=+
MIAGLAVLSSIIGGRPVSAKDSLEQALIPVLESYDLLKLIPAYIERAEWDKVRTVLFRPPVGRLKTTMGNVAELLEGDKSETAFDEYFELLVNLRDVDVNVYTNIFVPTSDAQVQYTAMALKAYQRSMDNYDRILALVPHDAILAARDAMASGAKSR